MATPDMDVIKEVPGYRIILKAVLKSQIQQLIEQLASATNEESIILTASVADGTLSHLGSDSAKGFLEDHEDVKSQFLGYCLKSHHKRKQEQEQRDREEEMRKAQEAAAASLALQQQQAQSIQSMGNMPGSMGYMPPRGPMPRFQATARSPRQQFRSPGGGLRHQPYPVTRPIQAAASPVRSPMKSPAKLDGQTIKLEPDDETSNQSATSQPSSPSSHQNMKSEPGADDANSESSSSHNEQNQEGLCLGADLSNSVSGDNIEHDPDVSVKLEAISDAEMDLEITGVEPGRPMQPQDWGANASGMNFDPTGATGSQADMTGQQGYKRPVCHHCQKTFNTNSDLDCHILIHTGERPFECSACQKQFNWKGHLHVHMFLHTREKPFECSVCHKRFNRKSILKDHMLVHTGKKPFKCSVCLERFNQKSILVRHILVHTAEKPFECSINFVINDLIGKVILRITSWFAQGISRLNAVFVTNDLILKVILSVTQRRSTKKGVVCQRQSARKSFFKAQCLVHLSAYCLWNTCGGQIQNVTHVVIFMPPFEEEGVYCFAHVGLSVGPSTRWFSDDNSRKLGPRIMKLHRYIDHDSQMKLLILRSLGQRSRSR
ncbi:putative zinc finger and SCAN domain-containing protein 5D isoform X2 [Dreissena polymorpha]|uniref:putative zinc finger and SCAN domain-containing protein 5D isoform X2 n=1 Tax=Dreissena polymorpha TaxID=45954 RepID=UPI0022645F2A|nr:putative zinc finger and SCAN domain-containing protein 5D isoform X2 [Dreissena polymorpha]